MSHIRIRGARANCLQSVDLDIPLGALVVVTGPSGSGKSSLAFDTIFAEGQRRLIELLSATSRRVAEQMPRPDVDLVEGLPPTLGCEQRTPNFGPFGTVASAIDLCHPLAMLFVRAGAVHCPQCDAPQQAITVPRMVDSLMNLPDKTRFVLSVALSERGDALWQRCNSLVKDGFSRLEVDGELIDLAEVEGPIVATEIRLQIDRLIRKEGMESRLADSLELALRVGDGRAWVHPVGLPPISLATGAHCHQCGCQQPAIMPSTLTLRSADGRCAACGGLGERTCVDRGSLVGDPNLTLRDGAITPWAQKNHAFFSGLLEDLGRAHGIDLDTPWASLSASAQSLVLNGDPESDYRGVVFDLEKRLDKALSLDPGGGEGLVWLQGFLDSQACTECEGSGLSESARSCRLAGMNIADVYRSSIGSLPALLGRLVAAAGDHEQLARRLVAEMEQRIDVASQLGLGHLPIGRSTTALSSGEALRLRLTEILSTTLRGVLFVLDEPSAGLHAQDAANVLALLRATLDHGNSVLLVEHDRQLIGASDVLIDMGPLAGRLGGRVVAQGSPAQVCANRQSRTGAFLSGRESIHSPPARKTSIGSLRLEGACANNLKSVDLCVPLGQMSCLVGVSGAGKTSLLLQSLYPALCQRASKNYGSVHSDVAIERVFEVASNSLQRSPRSTPSTFTGLSEVVRDLYAKLPESRARGFSKSRFSTNIAGGRCTACKGDGHLRVGQELFADLYVPCADCGGRRFDRQTLSVRYRGLDIAALHELSVDEAAGELAAIPKAISKLRALQKVGLGYLHLGQPATSLSGGELQRLMLARELAKTASSHCVYLIDEASLGLHWHDLQLLIDALGELVDAGHTVILADHHLELMRAADYLVELGPEAGDRGGQIIASGTPADLEKMDTPTGRALASLARENA